MDLMPSKDGADVRWSSLWNCELCSRFFSFSKIAWLRTRRLFLLLSGIESSFPEFVQPNGILELLSLDANTEIELEQAELKHCLLATLMGDSSRRFKLEFALLVEESD
jgi:hypothetical protein